MLMNQVNQRLLSADVPYANGIREQIDCFLARMEWAAGSADFLRGLGISDHVDYAAPLGNAEGGEGSCVLPNEVGAPRAIAGGAADDTERAAFCAG
jgi:hypothetical protein